MNKLTLGNGDSRWLFLFTAEYLGFDGYIKPFASATGEDILKGVNYGSGAAGIREESGQQMVLIIITYLLVIIIR